MRKLPIESVKLEMLTFCLVSETPEGKTAEKVISQGSLVGDDIMSVMLRRLLTETQSNW